VANDVILSGVADGASIIHARLKPLGIRNQSDGELAKENPQHLAANLLKTLVVSNKPHTADVGNVVLGTNSQHGQQGGELALPGTASRAPVPLRYTWRRPASSPARRVYSSAAAIIIRTI